MRVFWRLSLVFCLVTLCSLVDAASEEENPFKNIGLYSYKYKPYYPPSPWTEDDLVRDIRIVGLDNKRERSTEKGTILIPVTYVHGEASGQGDLMFPLEGNSSGSDIHMRLRINEGSRYKFYILGVRQRDGNAVGYSKPGARPEYCLPRGTVPEAALAVYKEILDKLGLPTAQKNKICENLRLVVGRYPEIINKYKGEFDTPSADEGAVVTVTPSGQGRGRAPAEPVMPVLGNQQTGSAAPVKASLAHSAKSAHVATGATATPEKENPFKNIGLYSYKYKPYYPPSTWTEDDLVRDIRIVGLDNGRERTTHKGSIVIPVTYVHGEASRQGDLMFPLEGNSSGSDIHMRLRINEGSDYKFYILGVRQIDGRAIGCWEGGARPEYCLLGGHPPEGAVAVYREILDKLGLPTAQKNKICENLRLVVRRYRQLRDKYRDVFDTPSADEGAVVTVTPSGQGRGRAPAEPVMPVLGNQRTGSAASAALPQSPVKAFLPSPQAGGLGRSPASGNQQTGSAAPVKASLAHSAKSAHVATGATATPEKENPFKDIGLYPHRDYPAPLPTTWSQDELVRDISIVALDNGRERSTEKGTILIPVTYVHGGASRQGDLMFPLKGEPSGSDIHMRLRINEGSDYKFYTLGVRQIDGRAIGCWKGGARPEYCLPGGTAPEAAVAVYREILHKLGLPPDQENQIRKDLKLVVRRYRQLRDKYRDVFDTPSADEGAVVTVTPSGQGRGRAPAEPVMPVLGNQKTGSAASKALPQSSVEASLPSPPAGGLGRSPASGNQQTGSAAPVKASLAHSAKSAHVATGATATPEKENPFKDIGLYPYQGTPLSPPTTWRQDELVRDISIVGLDNGRKRSTKKGMILIPVTYVHRGASGQGDLIFPLKGKCTGSDIHMLLRTRSGENKYIFYTLGVRQRGGQAIGACAFVPRAEYCMTRGIAPEAAVAVYKEILHKLGLPPAQENKIREIIRSVVDFHPKLRDKYGDVFPPPKEGAGVTVTPSAASVKASSADPVKKSLPSPPQGGGLGRSPALGNQQTGSAAPVKAPSPASVKKSLPSPPQGGGLGRSPALGSQQTGSAASAALPLLQRPSYVPAKFLFITFLMTTLFKKGWLDRKVSQRRNKMLHVREILLDSLVDTDMHAKVVTAEAGDTISLLMAVDALDRGQRMLLDSYKQSVEGYENLCWWQSNLRRVQGGSGIGALLWALYARFKEGGLPEHS